MSFEVRWSAQARADLVRLHQFLLDRAIYVEDLDLADRAVDEIEAAAIHALARTPFSFRKSEGSALWRELIVAFGDSGYVVLYEIRQREKLVVVHAVRHQLEADYH
jgi:plasmid stabilization system protein ParE